MNKTLLACGLCVALARSVFGQGSIDAITFPNQDGGLVGYVNGGTAWSFTPTTNLSVTEVGTIAFGSPVTVKVWQNTDSLLGSYAFTGAGESGSLQYTGIAPLTLLAGNAYSISVQNADPGSPTIIVKAYGNNYPSLSPFELSSHLTDYTSYLISTNGTWTAQTPPPGSSILYLGPTFRFDAVPEPSSFALLLATVAVAWPLNRWSRRGLKKS